MRRAEDSVGYMLSWSNSMYALNEKNSHFAVFLPS